MSTKAPEASIVQPANGAKEIELEAMQAPSPSVHHVEANDESEVLNKQDIFKIVAAGFSFFFSGTNDGSLGPLTPYIIRTYHVGTQHIALM